MRKLAIPLTAALAIAAAAVPAAAGAHTDPGQAPVARSDTALRPTAIEYGLIAALAEQQPVTESVTEPGVLDPDDDPAFDPRASAAARSTRSRAAVRRSTASARRASTDWRSRRAIATAMAEPTRAATGTCRPRVALSRQGSYDVGRALENRLAAGDHPPAGSTAGQREHRGL